MKICTSPDWVRNAVFYEIFLDRFANGDLTNDPTGVVSWGSAPTRDNFFGGDLRGILDHLPYLENLGVTALYLTPIFQAHSNHKYDTSDYLSLDPSFGSIQLFRSFVDEAHSKGIRIVLDAVFNHIGDGFWAFEDVKRNGASSKYASWFFIDKYPLNQDPPNYQTCGGVWYMPKLNTNNPEVKEYLLKASTYWMETCDIDGWRLDVPWKVSMDFWKLFRERIKRIKPDAYIVGEVWRDPRPWLQGDTCDGVMNYPLRNYILDYFVFDTMDAEDFNYEINLLRQVNVLASSFQLNLLGSHDTSRILTLCHGDIARAILSVVFLFTYVGAPMIYYGDEIGMTGDNDPDCRRCMLWDETKWENRLFDTYRILIRARYEHSALQRGEFLPLFIFNGIYAYLRRFDDDEVIVILNPRDEHHHIRIPLGDLNFKEYLWLDILGKGTFRIVDAHLQIDTLPAKSALILIPHNDIFHKET